MTESLNKKIMSYFFHSFFLKNYRLKLKNKRLDVTFNLMLYPSSLYDNLSNIIINTRQVKTEEDKE